MTNPYAGPIPRSYWVREDQLLAGPFPMGAVDALVAAGVTAFINLTQPFEGNYAAELPDDVQYQHHAIQDFDTPPPSQIAEILDAIDALLDEGATVYVHCWAGIGRTGTIIGCWLVRHGMDGEAALDLLEERRGRLPETADQRDMVRRWSQLDPALGAG